MFDSRHFFCCSVRLHLLYGVFVPLELDQCRQKLDEYQALRLRFIERETEMRLKDEMLDEKDRKIYNLQTVSKITNLVGVRNEHLPTTSFRFSDM